MGLFALFWTKSGFKMLRCNKPQQPAYCAAMQAISYCIMFHCAKAAVALYRRGVCMSEAAENSGLITRDEDIERAARSLKAMAHPLRLKILCVLGDQEISVQDIVDRVGTTQSNISQHLAILRDKGILSTRKEANRVFYRVDDSRTLSLIDMMRDVFCSMTP
jgi:ArsR family transcriptional regulator